MKNRNRFSSWGDVYNSGMIGDGHIIDNNADSRFVQNKMEEMIFNEMIESNLNMESLIQENHDSIPFWGGLISDVFTAIHSLSLKHTAGGNALNHRILDEFIKSSGYSNIKTICQGRELPTFDACETFCQNIADFLKNPDPELKRYLDVYEMLRTQYEKLISKLKSLALLFDDNLPENLEKRTIQLSNKADKKRRLCRRLVISIARFFRGSSSLGVLQSLIADIIF